MRSNNKNSDDNVVIIILVITMVAMSSERVPSAGTYSVRHRVLVELPIESRNVPDLCCPGK